MKSNGAIFHIQDMIGSKLTEEGPMGGPFYRGVPAPFHGGITCRIRGALAVLAGHAYATEWPKLGDLEKALDK